MSQTIQENEMLIASRFCQKYISELGDLVVENSRLCSSVVKECEGKISHERDDISILREKLQECRNYISDNQRRIAQIPNEISDRESDSRLCEQIIDSTPIPVYTMEYDYYRERWYETIDYSETEANRRYVSIMYERIEDNECAIDRLKMEKEKCESNLRALNQMVKEIETCITQKESLISKIQENIAYLQKSLATFRGEMEREQAELKVLDGKILKGAELIHSYGTTMAKIGYKDARLGYNSNDIFSINSAGLVQEIENLRSTVNEASALISNCAKSVTLLISQLQDSITEQAKQMTVNSAMEIKKINESYAQDVEIMKKALSFLTAY